MQKRLLLLLLTWPLLAHADPHYVAGYGFIFEAIELFVLGVMSLVVAQVVGRVLRWLMSRRFNLWVLTIASVTGCWLGMHRPLDFDRPEFEPMAEGTVMAVSGPSAPSPPPSVRYLAASSAVAVLLTALTTAAIAFWEQRNQYPEQET